MSSLAGEVVEIAHLPEQWPKATHLEHQPLAGFPVLPLRDQLGRSFRQIKQDCPAFKHRAQLAAGAVRVNDRRELVAGVQA